RLFLRPANVLVLDEPTNDLDMETLELLEALLLEYDGTLFVVSHDRVFLDNVVTQVIGFEGDGVLREYAGGYTEWRRWQLERRREAAPAGTRETPRPSNARQAGPRPRTKLSYKEARELEALPQTIEALEREQAQITQQLGDPAVYRDVPERVATLQRRFAETEDELMGCLARWEELEARQRAASA
ncbi:MAG: ABC transporter ATP-binding protein, partial [Burkholderiales bacterium]|nr:ABC transporter ATP-binding protein [Burkholderiales bacterium]